MTVPCCNRAPRTGRGSGVDAELQGVLDGDDPLVVGDEGNEHVEQRRVAAPGAAADEDIAAGVQHPLGLVTDVRGQRAMCDQLRRRKGSCAEAPHGDGQVRGWRGHTDGHARPRRPTGRRGSAAGNVPGHVQAHATLTPPRTRNARLVRSSSAPLVVRQACWSGSFPAGIHTDGSIPLRRASGTKKGGSLPSLSSALSRSRGAESPAGP